jgi:hypothetical protein
VEFGFLVIDIQFGCSRRESLRKTLGMEGMQIACGWRCSLALEKWLQKNSEWPKEANVKLKIHGGGMRRCKMLLRRRKSALDVCTCIRVWMT